MKLWTTWDLTEMPRVQREGLTNPTYQEIRFSNVAELMADEALSFEGELAFLEVDFPDDELDEWLTYCVASVSDDIDNLEMDFQRDLEAGHLTEEQEEEGIRFFERAKQIQTASQNLEVFGYACLYVEVPPEMIRVLDPLTMLDAVASDDKKTIERAIKTTQSTAIKDFGVAFWAFIASILTAIFAAGTISEGLEMAYGLRNLIEKSREAKERRRARAAERRREGKGRGRKKPKRGRRGASLGGAYQDPEVRAVQTPIGQMAYALLPTSEYPDPVQIFLRAGELWMYLKDAPNELVGAEEAEAVIRDAVRRWSGE